MKKLFEDLSLVGFFYYKFRDAPYHQGYFAGKLFATREKIYDKMQEILRGTFCTPQSYYVLWHHYWK